MQDRPDDLTLAGLVHDLANVFETMIEAAELLSSDPKWAKVAAAIRRSSNHGQSIVHSLKTSGEATDLDRTLDQAEALARDFLISTRMPEMEFQRRVEPGLQLQGDRGAWERVFVNLFLNAARMMPQGGVIEGDARALNSGVEIQVSDNGPGISARVLPRLFEPGFSTSPKRTGMGLHIVKTIVESFGGEVTAQNREHADGAVFRLFVAAVDTLSAAS